MINEDEVKRRMKQYEAQAMMHIKAAQMYRGAQKGLEQLIQDHGLAKKGAGPLLLDIDWQGEDDVGI